MKTKKLLLIAAYLSCTQINAQEAIASSGGNASGINGSTNYSVGQMVYSTNYGATGSLMQGVEQPFEIQVVLGVDDFNISLAILAYPNPTTSLLYLQVKKYDFEGMQYQLFDLNGRLLDKNVIRSETTTIQMERYPMDLYLLKVFDHHKEVKTFKIIKRT
ncbi:T9SS type A sorting domain-containing protein [Flavobacterium humi]|uniref:T9SS type A sorting domain-containing protein n=1 Tax=Flavobacterium humi TaxID=2562683 RepID=A0A4Z0LCC5_9FLAO|nr:T9SS type A sorting domain-containing protein [Flavobacterium humi]TGD59542.1 T9SS type A sorting domain-containing protein [Flavobacterium humi]